MPPQLYSSQGTPVRLGTKLGEGGEGTVLEVVDSDLVAKLYHPTRAQEKATKLAAMVALKTDRLLNLSAWPVDTVHDGPGGPLKGFLMPRVTGHKDIHILYGVKSRHADYPEARWPFLIQAAANVARAFNVIHEHGHVIGDVNHGGVVVSKNAMVRLVDCDSFQISANGQRFLCEVGVPTHTPPELQGKPFKGVVRTPDHDAFGLAVIIFQLLFMGRHPFSGAFLGRGDMPLEKAISEFRFAYGAGAPSRQMKQPPGTLSLEAVSRQVAGLFERAFLPGGVRPKPGEWIAPLGELSANLKQCAQSSGHNYLNSLTACPWCEIETRSGIVVFYPVYVAGVASPGGAFNITAIWGQIAAIQPPGPPPPLPVKSSVNAAVSPKVAQVKKARVRRSVMTTAVLAAACTVLLAIPLGAGSTYFLVLVACVAALSYAVRSSPGQAREFHAAKDDAERRWRDVEQRWRNLGDDQGFRVRRRELEATKAKYDALPNVRQRKLQELEKEVYARQLERFLDGYRIDSATISGIGYARKITLRSYGIETAADVTTNTILNVHGFGPTYTSKLLAWRASIEQRFKFDPRKGVDPLDRQRVEADAAASRMKIEQELRSGAAELRRMSDQIRASRDGVVATADAAIKALAQAEADLAASKATAALAPVFAVAGVALLAVFPLKMDFASMRANFARPTTASPSATPHPSVSASPTPSAEMTARAAKAAYSQGVTHMKAGKFAEAEAAFADAVSLESNSPDFHHELGYVQFRLRKFDEAITSLKQARTLRPKYPETHRVLAQVYEAKGNWAEAAKSYGEAVYQQPTHATTQYNYGKMLKRSGDSASAVRAMEQAVKLKPAWAAARYELGLLYLEAGEHDMAVEQYNAISPLNEELAGKLYVAIEGSGGVIQ